MTDQPDILAIDGGGTRCRVACHVAGQRHVVEVGSANANTDLKGTLASVSEGLALLADLAGLSPDALADVPAYVGLAGVIGPETAQAVAAGLPLSRVKVEDDRPAAVRGALGTDDGVTAHCGTGSFFAIQRDGGIRLTGGWGSVLGDEASAHWLGSKALLATLDVADGLRQDTPLSRSLLERYTSTAGIVTFAAHASPADFGALAPLVTRAADDGDPLAHNLLQRGADHISRTLIAMGWMPPLPICLTGGLARHYRDFLPSDMANLIADPQGEPIDGALSLAREFQKELAS